MFMELPLALVLLCPYVQRIRQQSPRHHHLDSCSTGHAPPPHGNLACSWQLLHILTLLRTNSQDGCSLQPPFPSTRLGIWVSGNGHLGPVVPMGVERG